MATWYAGMTNVSRVTFVWHADLDGTGTGTTVATGGGSGAGTTNEGGVTGLSFVVTVPVPGPAIATDETVTRDKPSRNLRQAEHGTFI